MFFLDTVDHNFVRIFQEVGISLVHLHDFYSDNSRIRLITCFIRSSDERTFEKNMLKIRSAALLTGIDEYETYCDKLESFVANSI